MIGSQIGIRRRPAFKPVFAALLLVGSLFSTTFGHALGNFTINHFARVEVGAERITVRYVVDMAEIPALQELQTADATGRGTPTAAELNAYLQRAVAAYAEELRLTVDGVRLPLKPVKQQLSLPAGAGGLQTLRIECDYETAPLRLAATKAQRLRFEDKNHQDRLGWHELVVGATAGMSIFDSTAYGNAVTDELKAYPENLSTGPLNERSAELSFTKGAMPAQSAALRTRANTAGATVAPQNEPDATQATSQSTTGAGAQTLFARGAQTINSSRDRLTELISVPTLTPVVALLGLLFAVVLGGLHAMSPGHGKTVVGAYLVGSRGTAKHAAFLGLTVTVTHTLGVFALGLITLFASQYIVPERLFPILSFVSGGIVLAIGLSLFVRRLRGAFMGTAHGHDHAHDHASDHGHTHGHETHEHEAGIDPTQPHSHGGRAHTHLPPGADGGRVTWRSLLALGISGGLLPCPSALVVLLSAISLHRVGYGLLLVVAFSFGLAMTLTVVGLAFVYAGRLLKRPANSTGRLVRALPVFSAFVIACAGGAICYEALSQAGVNLSGLFAGLSLQAGTISTGSVLAVGLVFGLKHAVEADHLAAVSTIVSERKSLLSSSLVGGMWGVGHTISLLVAGIVVLVLHIEIGARLALALEFGVALMLVALGLNALRKLARGGTLHLHTHRHFGHSHMHPHLHAGAHETDAPLDAPTHHGFRVGVRPLLIGMVHGLAGSAALMLLVLTTIKSQLVGLAYITVFGVGSIGGMMIMSALVGLPMRLTAARFDSGNRALRALAGAFSLCFGLFMVYEIGFVDGLFR